MEGGLHVRVQITSSLVPCFTGKMRPRRQRGWLRSHGSTWKSGPQIHCHQRNRSSTTVAEAGLSPGKGVSPTLQERCTAETQQRPVSRPPKIPISHLSIKNRRKTHLTAAEQLTSQAQGSCAGAEDESLRILPPGQREDQVNRPNLEGGMIWETSEPVPRGRVGCGMRLDSGSFWGLL